jgi:hypothetical protein
MAQAHRHRTVSTAGSSLLSTFPLDDATFEPAHQNRFRPFVEPQHFCRCTKKLCDDFAVGLDNANRCLASNDSFDLHESTVIQSRQTSAPAALAGNETGPFAFDPATATDHLFTIGAQLCRR